MTGYGKFLIESFLYRFMWYLKNSFLQYTSPYVTRWRDFMGSDTWILSDMNDRNALHPANRIGHPFHIPLWSQMHRLFEDFNR